MIDLAIGPRLDDLLHDYFAPGGAPENLAARVLRAARERAATLERFHGRLGIQATSDGVSLIRPERLPRPATPAARRVADEARRQIAEYLAGRRVFFSVPVDLSAAPDFQRRVLEAARGIPFGEARPYAWVAERIGHPNAVRAVGTALGRNPVPIIVPCHRVWRTDGGLGGYLFGGDVKRRLAELERTTPLLEGSSRTRVVCRVGCGRIGHARPEERVVFASVEDARSVGYRPCDACAPSSAA
jgi:O-6-methylguanine DNA methyltransferase